MSRYVVLISAAAFILGGCASKCHSPTQMASNFLNRQQVVATSTADYPAKNPQTVALFNDSNAPRAPYRIIAMASVSRHNLIGMKRSDATMQDMMKHLAANLGGDGLINISNSPENLKAHVIAYQKILI